MPLWWSSLGRTLSSFERNECRGAETEECRISPFPWRNPEDHQELDDGSPIRGLQIERSPGSDCLRPLEVEASVGEEAAASIVDEEDWPPNWPKVWENGLAKEKNKNKVRKMEKLEMLVKKKLSKERRARNKENQKAKKVVVGEWWQVLSDRFTEAEELTVSEDGVKGPLNWFWWGLKLGLAAPNNKGVEEFRTFVREAGGQTSNLKA